MFGRRRFVGAALAAAGACSLDALSVARLLAQPACRDPAAEGELLGTLPLTGDRWRATPYGEAVGGPGLDTRVFTDLSLLAPDRLVTPADRVFVRTAAPTGIAQRLAGWSVTLTGTEGPISVAADDLRRRAVPMGAHLIECAGNSDPNNFGLMSVAEWSGVSLSALVDRLRATPSHYGVLVSGFDEQTPTARSSVPGASWIVPLADLSRLGAFLATGMNGTPLPLAHGAPVRLVVPGWYGCAWIKWVRDMRLIGPDEPVTPQMAEFAGRTHQQGRPFLARDYDPPTIDLAATPIRVERRRVNGAVHYLVVGIVWGGQTPARALEIRFGSRDSWKPVALCPPPSSAAAWSLWSYRWAPTEAGVYNISLRCPDSSVRTRRLDMFFYSRRVEVVETGGGAPSGD
jgi:DMSO/TMAO reductase YedYZ molybdopterin-dependent catalytic subunit